MKGRLQSVPDYKCRKCTGERLDHLEIRSPAESVVLSNKSLEVVNKFCYLGDISAAGGVEECIVGKLDVAGRNLGNICLSFLPMCFHCAQTLHFPHTSGVLFSTVVRPGHWKKRTWQSWIEMT